MTHGLCSKRSGRRKEVKMKKEERRKKKEERRKSTGTRITSDRVMKEDTGHRTQEARAREQSLLTARR